MNEDRTALKDVIVLTDLMVYRKSTIWDAYKCRSIIFSVIRMDYILFL